MQRFSPNPNLAHLIRWYEWEDEAFREAREQNKPVMLFLAAFWCRYCQRMDEQAFSDRENMALLNVYFIALRAEDAKRPDIDARYNLNGWPTIAFFAPGGELLSAANYLPAEEFKELLLNVYLDYQRRGGALAASEPGWKTEPPVRTGERRQTDAERLSEITAAIMAIADPEHGGYGRGQKFIQADANDFLLSRYEATKEARHLTQVCLTLDGMRAGGIHDFDGGGFFRTTTGVDWSQPHREKLLIEQAGLLLNYLRAYRLMGREEYGRTAEEIVGYLDRVLFDSDTGAFFGCEDFLRYEPEDPAKGGFYSIIDRYVYTDANAKTALAYLEASDLLGRASLKARALGVLDFLWQCCRGADGAMCHYHDGSPRLPGLLVDQAAMGTALVRASRSTGDAAYLERAKALAACITSLLKNPGGGYFDRLAGDMGFLKFPLTPIEGNGKAALFFLSLFQTTGDLKYRDDAGWALEACPADVSSFGVHAASFGQALEISLNL